MTKIISNPTGLDQLFTKAYFYNGHVPMWAFYMGFLIIALIGVVIVSGHSFVFKHKYSGIAQIFGSFITALSLVMIGVLGTSNTRAKANIPTEATFKQLYPYIKRSNVTIDKRTRHKFNYVIDNDDYEWSKVLSQTVNALNFLGSNDDQESPNNASTILATGRWVKYNKITVKKYGSLGDSYFTVMHYLKEQHVAPDTALKIRVDQKKTTAYYYNDKGRYKIVSTSEKPNKVIETKKKAKG